MTCARAAELLEEYAFWLELGGTNPFKTRAWVKAAEAIEDEPGELAELVARDDFEAIEGIGKSSAAALRELAASGELAVLEAERAKFPTSLLELRVVRGLGTQKIAQLHEAGISDRAALQAAIADGRLGALRGFGAKTIAKLAEVLATLAEGEGRLHLDEALALAASVRDWLRQQPGIARVEPVGELGRQRETVAEPTLLVEAGAGDEGQVPVAAARIAPLRLETVLSADFVPTQIKRTGSTAFLGQLRGHAESRGLDLDAVLAASRDEAEAFAALGLQFIDPVLREGFDEVERAAAGTLPRLIERDNLRGTFHNHTTASDGRHSLREMAEAALGLGLQYLGIADHSVGAFQANGLSAERLRAQIAEIAELNAGYAAEEVDFRVLAGSEVEVKRDGSLDFDDEILAELDYVVAAVHVPHGLDEAAQTERTIQAISHPLVTMLAHPSARLLLRRPAMAIDLRAVAEAAAATHTVVEINANPRRLDLDWRTWRELGDAAPLTSVNPDAHAIDQLLFLDLGCRLARKAGRSREQVLNTRPREEIEAWLARPKAKR